MLDPSFWRGRRVFVTGHTGFKGGWLVLWLADMGAVVTGYSLAPETSPNLFTVAGVADRCTSLVGDVRDLPRLVEAMAACRPEVVLHLAAQPLVRRSYREPVETYATNVMGTVHCLEAARRVADVRAVVVVTSDKCYENRDWVWAYRETEPMGGHDPYSNSKGCSELVVSAFRDSFFGPASTCRLGSGRAGNVIGGGDWSEDRLIPDMVRSFGAARSVEIRSPRSTRPWQHVLEPLHGYLTLAEALLSADAARYASAFNFGPHDDDARPVRWIADRMVQAWGEGAAWLQDGDPGVHEAGFLKLDISRARAELGWQPKLTLSLALDWLVDWYKAEDRGEDMHAVTLQQIRQYEALPMPEE